MLTKDQILAATKKTVRTVNVPGMGEVGIRVMSGRERERWESVAFNDDGKIKMDDFRARLLCQTICDESGSRMFADDDVAAIADLPAPAVVLLFTESQRVNALTKEDVDELTKK